jgi:tetratricopeptide (TPR) repeat protein
MQGRSALRLVHGLVPGLVCVLAYVLVGGSATPSRADEAAALDPAVRLERALDEYARALSEPNRDARLALFSRAEEGFAAVIDAGYENAALYTNLGNAALQAEHPGRAVLAYHRALRLDPDASTPRQNLDHVRTLLPKWVPRPDRSDMFDQLLLDRRFPVGLRSLVAAGCFAFAALCFAVSVRRREGAWRSVSVFVSVIWLILVATVVFGSLGGAGDRAVLTDDETYARSADSPLAPLALPEPLPAGVEVERLEERADWARVRLANGRDVWVRKSSVASVAP